MAAAQRDESALKRADRTAAVDGLQALLRGLLARKARDRPSMADVSQRAFFAPFADAPLQEFFLFAETSQRATVRQPRGTREKATRKKARASRIKSMALHNFKAVRHSKRQTSL